MISFRLVLEASRVTSPWAMRTVEKDECRALESSIKQEIWRLTIDDIVQNLHDYLWVGTRAFHLGIVLWEPLCYRFGQFCGCHAECTFD